jgi:phenylacetate-CoA ligase
MSYLDLLETRDPAQREADLLLRLPHLLAQAQKAQGWSQILAGVNPADITSRSALAQLPVTRKSNLKEQQSRIRPFGGLNILPSRDMARIFMSPGPIFDPQGAHEDWGQFARPLYALGVRSGHLIQNCFSYHFTPGAFMVEAGAAKLGCSVLPAGSGQTEMQVLAMNHLRPEIYTGTPSFLKIILEKARQMGLDVSSLQYALVGGEALPPSLRGALQSYGVPHVLQMYGVADIGCIAYETETDGVANPGMVLNEDLLLEIVRPGTGEPVMAGEVGEVLITNFNLDYPLIRFGTGDLSAILPGIAPCGRSNMRLRGWLGRSDQAVKVRGMFVHPNQVAEIVQRHVQIRKARLVVSGSAGRDEMVLYCEVDGIVSDEQMTEIQASIREVSNLRGDVKLLAPGSLVSDGLVIEDVRDYA